MTGLVMAVPKGRILTELTPLFAKVGIVPEDAFFDDSERQLQFTCKNSDMRIIRVRSFDVATFVAFGAAHLGVCGSDVLMEHEYNDIYAPLSLNIGHCRLSLAEPEEAQAEDMARVSHLRVATKYPTITKRYFADKGIQAECIKLSGAMELAPKLGLAGRIVDLVSSGKTLKANGLREVEVITQVSSRLIVNRMAFKTRSSELGGLVERFRAAVGAG